MTIKEGDGWTYVDGTTYKIVDDYGPVYVVLSEDQEGVQAYHVKRPTPEFGKHPVLGDDPLGNYAFRHCVWFGHSCMRTKVVYSHRHPSRWKRFLGVSLFHEYTPIQARAMANMAARKYLKTLDAIEIEKLTV